LYHFNNIIHLKYLLLSQNNFSKTGFLKFVKLSVVIVNYNVRHFLEQCLYSVQKALHGMEAEVFVVDNNSVDGSCSMVREKFSWVKLIENKKNTGFSFANNQAIRESSGEYVLLLNPDTVVEEDTFNKVVGFMDAHPDAGGLGVKMIDGKGNFLPESKRGLPTPIVAFYKIFGLSALFPKSKIFGKYHLGFLDKEKNHEVEVLSGAFMLLRKETLEKTGLLDEIFFMYGEDIDLSYRNIKAGYKNYYFSDTTILHYKGESTKKGSINYVLVFYNAMIIFAKKHFSSNNARLFSFLINSAIYFRAAIAIIIRFLKFIALPLSDGLLIYLGFYLIKPYWELHKFGGAGYYPETYMKYAVPVYVLVWIISIFFSGGYDKPIRLLKIGRGILLGTLSILVVYSLLPETYRYSRALLLLGSSWVFVTIILQRLIMHFLPFRSFKLGNGKKKKLVILGSKDEALRVQELLKQTDINPEIAGFVSPDKNEQGKNFIGNLNQIDEIIRINSIDEIIFCAKDVSSQAIIGCMLELTSKNIDFKIASPDSVSVIGSNSINTAGDLYTISLNLISKVSNKRNKRLLDVLISLSFLIFSPFLLLIVNKKAGFFRNILSVLSGSLSWVGYYKIAPINIHDLPKLRNGVLTPFDLPSVSGIKDNPDKINMNYAKDYRILNDLTIVLKNIKNIGR